MIKPILSVIIPVYNAKEHIEKCLNGILCQKLDNIEIIIINDKSTDNTDKILEEYKKRDKRIVLINNDKNIGTGASRNKGILFARGEYIGFVDNDDFISDDYFLNLYNKIKENQILNDMLNKAYSLRSKASDAIRHETEKLSQINKEIKGKTAVRNSIPPVLWINMQEKDKYGNPIKRPVDNSFEIDSYNNILKNLENKKEQIEKQLYKYEFIREKSESWIEKYRDISFKISNLPGLDSIRSMLEVQLKDIRTAVKDAIYFAQMIMKSSISVNSMKNKGDIPLIK